MSNRFLISVATVALIAGTGFANAQGMRDTPAAQQSAPPAAGSSASERGSPSAAPMNRESGGSSGMKGAESSGAKGAPSDMKASESKEGQPGAAKSAQDDKMPGQKSKSMSSETETKGGKDMKADGRDGKNSNMNAETKGADGKAQTTGNAATSAKGAPPAEKRTQISSAFKSEKIQETTNVNFNISVGTRVPASVRFVPLPPRIVEIYPEWRGYDVIFVHGQYIVLSPETHEIVYIIEG